MQTKREKIRVAGVIEIDWWLPEGLTVEEAVQNAQDALQAHFDKHGLRFRAMVGLDNATDSKGEYIL